MADGTDVTVARLEEQLAWYDAKASHSQRMFKRLKAATIIAAALVPISALCRDGSYIAAGLGFVIVVVEGFQQLGQYQQTWFTYRATAEALKHEKYLYYAPAGDYPKAQDPHRLLAERVESLVSQEHARWSAAQEAALKQRKDDK
ncbi:MAG TPA: DUF4231 domain-containing protein [Thermoanaerobaculia bacterium]|nr:DUF4231 domain-containing protein [Thermoanaerobaculia bacterium]